MAEERWHDFAKEKPSEDMEGRNFIVSNGHYEKIATWCGYWENEPFMGDRLCDEVVRWKFYFTPEEEKANEATRTEPKPMKCDELEEYYYYEDRVITPSTHMYRVYHADEVDAAIAELKAENERLKKQRDDLFTQGTQKAFDLVGEKLRHRATRRALWLARALRARDIQRWWIAATCSPRTEVACIRWNNIERKCRAKAEEYK